MAFDLKSIHWKRHANTIVKVLLDFKVLGGLALIGFTIYAIGWDTILKNGLNDLKARQEAIDKQKEQLKHNQELQTQYGQQETQLQSLDVRMIPIPPGDNGQVVAVKESTELLKLAQGQMRNGEALPPLEPPHNKRKNVSLTPATPASETIDILQADPSAPPAAPAAPAAGDEASRGMGEEAAPATSLPVERHDFELKVSGTYPAIADLINELITQKKLIRINKISIAKPATTDEPDPKADPTFPVDLDAVISLSIFLYASNAAPSP